MQIVKVKVSKVSEDGKHTCIDVHRIIVILNTKRRPVSLTLRETYFSRIKKNMRQHMHVHAHTEMFYLGLAI